MKTIIIGGVAGGMSAATRLRRLDETREIIVFERGPDVSFANCGLPYYVGGVIENRDALLLQTPDTLRSRFALDVRPSHEVVAIDPAKKTVTARRMRDGSLITERYNTLVLAGGATAFRTPTDGSVAALTLRSLDDVDRITERLSPPTPDAPVRVIVVGAGFIGLEAVENLVERGAAVTLVQRGSHVMSPLDPEMAEPVHRRLVASGVDVHTGTTVHSIADGIVLLDDDTAVRADLVIDAAGVRPDTTLAVIAGLEIGPTGGIAVDTRQRTSDPSIYAVGDGVEKIDHLSGEPTLVTMAGLANRHGRSAADAIAGHPQDDAHRAFGTAIVGVLGLTIAVVGWSETRLQATGRPHRVVHVHPSSHAGYYPGAQQMAMKLLIDPAEDTILGAQIVGGEGVDKRIDVVATAMAGGITASRLSRLELAYAPQYGSAKDPINMAGYVAENLATGTTATLQWHEVEAHLASGGVLVDVRSPAEHARGSIPGSRSLPLDELRDRHSELPAEGVLVHCQVGQRGHTAARLLTQLGHTTWNLDGGWLTWAAGTASSNAGD